MCEIPENSKNSKNAHFGVNVISLFPSFYSFKLNLGKLIQSIHEIKKNWDQISKHIFSSQLDTNQTILTVFNRLLGDTGITKKKQSFGYVMFQLLQTILRSTKTNYKRRSAIRIRDSSIALAHKEESN